MFGDVIAAFIAATSLTATVWCWYQGLFVQWEDELFSLYLFMGLIFLPIALLFGMMAGVEARIFIGVIWFVGICFFGARSFVRFEETDRH